MTWSGAYWRCLDRSEDLHLLCFVFQTSDVTLPITPLKTWVENVGLYKTSEGYKKTRPWQAKEGMAGMPKDIFLYLLVVLAPLASVILYWVLEGEGHSRPA